MREIPDNININETTTGAQDEMDNVIFDEHMGDEDSGDDDIGLPRHNQNRGGNYDSPSDADSNNDDDDQEYNNPNHLPKNTGNLNAGNLIGKKKESGKGARNDRRQAISGSESEGHDDLAHI